MRVLADFNEIYDEKFIWALRRRDTLVAGEEPRVGELVELYDHDGTTCFGWITEVTDLTIDCVLDWDSFQYTTVDIPADQTVYERAGSLTKGEIQQAL